MNKKIQVLFILISVVMLISSVYYYPVLPDKIPTHWDFSGEVNQYSGKWMIFVLSILPIGIYLLMGIMPKIDPKKASYLKHGKAYATVKVAIFLFLTALYVLTLLVSLGHSIQMDMIVKFAAGLLFIIIGNVLSQARHNYFFGIKTPWTLASEEVWKKTHRVGAYSFVIMGIITCILSLIPGRISGYIVLASVIIAAGYPTVYSYIKYRELQKEK